MTTSEQLPIKAAELGRYFVAGFGPDALLLCRKGLVSKERVKAEVVNGLWPITFQDGVSLPLPYRSCAGAKILIAAIEHHGDYNETLGRARGNLPTLRDSGTQEPAVTT